MNKIKSIALLLLFTTLSTVVSAQKYEMILFSGDYHCCQADLWETFEKTVAEIAKKSIKNKNFEFRIVKVSDKSKKQLIDALGGEPQNLILRDIQSPNKVIDMSEFARAFLRNNDRTAFEKAIKEKFYEIRK